MTKIYLIIHDDRDYDVGSETPLAAYRTYAEAGSIATILNEAALSIRVSYKKKEKAHVQFGYHHKSLTEWGDINAKIREENKALGEALFNKLTLPEGLGITAEMLLDTATGFNVLEVPLL